MTNLIQEKDQLYNGIIKERYLGQIEDVKTFKSTKNIFIRFSDRLEKPLNKDLYEMSKAELMAVIPNLEITNFTDIRIKLSFIIDYIDWAYRNNLTKNIVDINREINIYEINLTKPMSMSHIKDDETFANILETTYDIYNVNNKAVLWCLIWMGIPIKEAVLIKNEDVNLTEYTVKTKDTLLKIPNAFYKIFKCYVNHTHMYSHIRSEDIIRRLIDNGFFIKPIEIVNSNSKCSFGKKPCKPNSLSVKLSEFKKEYRLITGKKVLYSTNTILSSGIFFRAYKDEQEGIIINDEYMIDKFNINVSFKGTKARDRIEQYKLYKRVFWE